MKYGVQTCTEITLTMNRDEAEWLYHFLHSHARPTQESGANKEERDKFVRILNRALEDSK